MRYCFIDSGLIRGTAVRSWALGLVGLPLPLAAVEAGGAALSKTDFRNVVKALKAAAGGVMAPMQRAKSAASAIGAMGKQETVGDVFRAEFDRLGPITVKVGA